MRGFLTWLFGLIFGTTKASETDQALGRANQQRDDSAQAQKEDERAKQIDEGVGRLSDAELDERLRPPADPNRPG